MGIYRRYRGKAHRNILRAFIGSASAASVILLCELCGELSSALAFCAAILIHESGHIATAAILKIPLDGISVTPFGIRMSYAFSAISPRRALAVITAGSAVGISCAALALAFHMYEHDFGMDFIIFSLAFGVVNLLPVSGLDGGEATAVISDMLLSPKSSHRIKYALSASFAVIFWIFTVRAQLRSDADPSMLFISLYLLYSSLPLTR